MNEHNRHYIPPHHGPLAGCYRGVVVDTLDPQQLKRYLVRVHAIHHPDVAAKALPWAEYCGFGGQYFGDIPAFQADDEVWVSFEGGNADYPIIMGGILSAKNGVNGVSQAQRDDYARNRERWTRTDRRGNTLEMSPNPDENWIRMQSGESEVRCQRNDKAVLIFAKTRISQRTAQSEQTCDELLITVNDNGVIDIQKVLTLTSHDRANIHATNELTLGEYRDPLWPVTDKHKTNRIFVKAVSVLDEQSENAIRRKAGTTITSECGTTYQHKTGATHKLESGQKMSVKVLTGGYDTTVVQGNMNVDVQAGNLTATVSGNIKATALGSGEISTVGQLLLHSDTKVKITAPVIEATADVSFKATAVQSTVEGTAKLDLKGALIQVTSSAMTKIDGGGIIQGQAGLIKLN